MSAPDPRARLLALQRTAGNRAAARVAPVLARSLSSWWHAVEISAVDARPEADRPWYSPPRYAGPMANLTHMNTVRMTSAQTMVDGVLRMLGTEDTIKRLNIFDHGSPDGIEMGDDWINAGNVGSFEATLARLRGHFTSDGFVFLGHCDAGQAAGLMRALARIWGVRVVGGEGLSNPVYRVNLGHYRDVTPEGGSSEHWFGPFWR